MRSAPTQTVKISPTDGIAELRDAMPNGAEVVFETAGVQGSAERAFGLAARGGNVVLVGLNKSPQPLVLSDLVLREVNVQTTLAHVCGTDIPEALHILSRLPLSQTIPVTCVSLDDVVTQGFTPLSQGALSTKVLVAPNGN